MSAICDHPECDRPVYARGLCSMHYNRAHAAARKAGEQPLAGCRKADEYESSPVRAQLVRELETLRDQLNAGGADDRTKLQAMRDYAISFLRLRYNHRAAEWRQVGEIV